MPSAAACPYNDSPCLGPIGAGTYRTEDFWIPLEYTVPDGWDNIEDYADSFDLRFPASAMNGGWNAGGATAGIGVWYDLGRAPDGDLCGEVAPLPATTVSDWIGALTSDPDLQVDTPNPVHIGGLDGMEVNVGISPNYTGTCDFGGATRSKSFLVQTEHAGTHRAFPEFPERVIFLSTATGSTVTILIEDRFPEDAYQTFLTDQALPVIDSFIFQPG